MGDKSPKSKDRDKKQKKAAKAEQTTAARSKQDAHNSSSLLTPKGKK